MSSDFQLLLWFQSFSFFSHWMSFFFLPCSLCILLYLVFFYNHNTNVLTEKCSPVWQPTSIISPVCGNHTWAKNRSASGFTCLHYARGELDSTSEPLTEASEIKSEGSDLTEVLLVTRQKLVFCVGSVALMWFHKQEQRWKWLGVIFKYGFHDLSIKFSSIAWVRRLAWPHATFSFIFPSFSPIFFLLALFSDMFPNWPKTTLWCNAKEA